MEIEELIELRKEDTFLNHLWTVFSRDFRPTGEIGRYEIKVWRQNAWNATFYPIFKLELNTNNNLINITDTLNPVGKSIIGIFLIGFLYLVFPKNLYEFNFLDNWSQITLIGIFILILVFIAGIIYRFEKKNQLEQIFELLDMEIEQEKNENEWSIKNILIRLFTYPFCLFLIGLNIFLIIPNGQYFLAAGIFVFVGFYLIADLRMIFRKNPTDNS
ncbi:hypothetical protein UMM65_01400 [Aureibaculum sp. 2210JD6-5]|uniref:hypothetical protein n=1 Tax=Aureibaculum sp. 2210JD6-5 TaxID=3103957 RepID=UPI002AAE4638|nr:hypothetical protein [Aureibaculum sp. 2210JD6-5]MDY7393887.1 hypothetical protein [Aureibaculum sp. 2210JD6-5]